MQPHVEDFTLPRGDYFGLPFRIRTRVWDPTANGDAGGDWVAGGYRDLTGWTGLFMIRLHEDDTAVAVTGTVDILDQVAVKGGIHFWFEGADTQGLVGEYRYDVQLTNELGQPRTYLSGTFTFTKDVSR